MNLAEVAVGLSASVPLKGFNQFTVTNIRCDGDKRGQSHERKTASRRTEKKDGNKRTRTFDGKKSKSPDLEEIIALFRRVQLSISEGGSKGTEKRRSESQKDKPSAESILDVLRESGKPVKKGNYVVLVAKQLYHLFCNFVSHPYDFSFCNHGRQNFKRDKRKKGFDKDIR